MSIYIPNRKPIGNYVYYYIRSKNSNNGKIGTPYYIGKGVRRRAWSKLHNVSVPSNENIIIIADNLTHEQAIAIEILHIKFWGRIDIKNGILRNRTSGGEGTSGFKHTPEEIEKIKIRSKKLRHSTESRLKISIAGRGRIVSDKTRKKMSMSQKGRKHSIESRKKMSLLRIGVPLSESHRASLKNRTRTSEQIRKHKIAMANFCHTEETKRKISIALTGRKLSDETKQKMRKPKSTEAKNKLKLYLSSLSPEAMYERMSNARNCNQQEKILAIKKAKSSKFLLITTDNREIEFHSYDNVESITGYNYQHIKWRLKKFNGLLHNGNKIIPITLYKKPCR